MLTWGQTMRRAMVEDREGRVDFGMAEALAYGTLALHRGVRPPHALPAGQQASAGEDLHGHAQPGTLDAIAIQIVLSTDCAMSARAWGQQ